LERTSWWPARLLFGVAAFNITLGVISSQAWL
jgi:hypothetical protein